MIFMKKNPYLIVFLGISLLYACHSSNAPVTQKKSMQDTIQVQTLKLNTSQDRMPISVSGQFTTDNEVMLSFKIGGLISRVLVKEGDAVKKGQLLATLNLTEIDAQMQQTRLNHEKAKRDYQRTKNLYSDSVATLEQLQNSKTALQVAEQQLNLVGFNRKYAEIRAAENGYVLKKLADAGQQVTAGSPVLQTNGLQSGKWQLKVGISDQEWASIKINDQAELETTAAPGQHITGFVSRKSEGIDGATGTFTAYITLSGKAPSAIASGMFGKASIKPSAAAKHASSWKIPYEALLDGDGSEGYVFITNDNKTAKRLKVTVGPIEGHTVTITGGLENAGSLIVSGSAYLTDQSPIVVQPLKAAL